MWGHTEKGGVKWDGVINREDAEEEKRKGKAEWK